MTTIDRTVLICIVVLLGIDVLTGTFRVVQDIRRIVRARRFRRHFEAASREQRMPILLDPSRVLRRGGQLDELAASLNREGESPSFTDSRARGH